MGGRWHHPIMISVMIVIIISNDRILIASIIVNVDIIIIESMKSRLYFSFLFLNFCLARTRLGSASTIGTIGIVTSWPGDSHKQTNKNICHICNYRKQYNYNSHKYTNVNNITKQIPIILKDMTDARFKQYKKDFSCKLHKHFLQVYLWTSWSFLDGGVIESELIFYNQSYFAGLFWNRL